MPIIYSWEFGRSGHLPATQFEWDASIGSPTPDGYRIYWGTSPGSHPNGPIEDTGLPLKEALSTIPMTAGITYYVVSRAYVGSLESADSNEIAVLNGVRVG